MTGPLESIAGLLAEALLSSGESRYQGHVRNGDVCSSLRVCLRVCEQLGTLGQEGRNSEFAVRMIRHGRELGSDTVVLRGFDFLVDGALREGLRGALPGIRRALDRTMRRLPCTPVGEDLLLRLRTRLGAAGSPLPG